jgi:hypothetical protein
MQQLNGTLLTRRLCLAGWVVLAVGLFGFYLANFVSKTAIVLPLGTAAVAMILGHRWALRTEIVTACLFLAILGMLFCQERTFLFSW